MILVRWLISAVAVMLVAYLVPGITVAGFVSASLVALVLGFANAVVRPILVFLTLPITILTLGFFILVINAFLFMVTSSLVPGFHVDGFWPAFIGSIVMAIIGWMANMIFEEKRAANTQTPV